MSIFNGKNDINRYRLSIVYKAVINGKDKVTKEGFRKEAVFTDALNYLKANPSSVDIILCDFDLGTTKGSTFLLEAKRLEQPEIAGIQFYILSAMNTRYIKRCVTTH